jgi:patatin-like phospholipase/acyl hydrolase
MDLVGLIKNFFGAIMSAVGLARQRDSEKNAPDVKAAAIAQDEQNAQDKTRKAIATKDIDEERRELAE